MDVDKKREDVKKADKEADEKDKRKEGILEEIQQILKQFNGEESNIPISNRYWTLLNQYREK